ncbi:MAG: VOC family protein [Deltaproteobacteria bacterium]|nr:VOC family protein [Deltaproteobacteria bacterium]
MAKFVGVNHLALATGDMDRTIRFWRDLLGMRLVAGWGKPGYRQYLFEISDKSMIVFFEWPKVEAVPEKDHGYPVAGPFIFDHLALEVAKDEDLWELKDQLETAGFWVSEVVDHGFIHSLYSFDPNGIPLEFTTPVPNSDLHHHPVMIDRDPSPVTQEGPDPQPEKWPPVTKPTPLEDRRIYPGPMGDLTDKKKKNWFRHQDAPDSGV